MSPFYCGVAAEAYAAALLAHCGIDVSVQYGANQPEYDLLACHENHYMKISVKGSRRLQALGPAHLAALHAQVEAQRAKRLVELDHAGGQPGPPCAASGDLAATVEQELAAWRQHIAAMADSVQIATTRYPSPDHDPVARRHGGAYADLPRPRAGLHP